MLYRLLSREPRICSTGDRWFPSVDSVYFYNPLPAGLTTEEQSYIIGTQANIWGEYIQTPEAFEYMAFPRLLAMSEVQWTQPEYKDFVIFYSQVG